MVVQHNLTAMNANRMLGVTVGRQAKSTEKLSSGYRINRAADDAAGLSISEKMRKQIRGLNQASSNAQDGISCVQTAEGALTEVHSMLQRMNELAVKAANGTMSEDDRQYVQDEIDQLIIEIDRVSETTKFNETYLLKGEGARLNKDLAITSTGTETNVVLQSGSAANQDLSNSATIRITADAVFGENATDSVTVAGKTYDYKDYKDANELTDAISSNQDVRSAENRQAFNAALTATDGTNATALTNVTMNSNTGVLSFDFTGVTAASTATTLTVAGKTISFTAGSTTAASDSDSQANLLAALEAEFGDGNVTISAAGAVTVQTAADSELTVNAAGERDALEFNLHVGSESPTTNKIGVNIETMGAEGLGISGLKATSEKVATDAIDVISDAIKSVSRQRSALGAVQNRLEHTIANLDNVAENTSAAESRIRDTDMASEMVEYSKNNILAQAGQSMLAQANQATQGVLSLL